MKLKFFFGFLALFMGLATWAMAQNHHNNGYANRGHNNRYRNNCNNNYYNQTGPICYNNGGGAYNNGRYGRRMYNNRRMYRRPANYCQPAPVVVYQAPVYCPPRPRVMIGRPRVNINIGF